MRVMTVLLGNYTAWWVGRDTKMGGGDREEHISVTVVLVSGWACKRGVQQPPGEFIMPNPPIPIRTERRVPDGVGRGEGIWDGNIQPPWAMTQPAGTSLLRRCAVDGILPGWI